MRSWGPRCPARAPPGRPPARGGAPGLAGPPQRAATVPPMEWPTRSTCGCPSAASRATSASTSATRSEKWYQAAGARWPLAPKPRWSGASQRPGRPSATAAKTKPWSRKPCRQTTGGEVVSAGCGPSSHTRKGRPRMSRVQAVMGGSGGDGGEAGPHPIRDHRMQPAGAIPGRQDEPRRVGQPGSQQGFAGLAAGEHGALSVAGRPPPARS